MVRESVLGRERRDDLPLVLSWKQERGVDVNGGQVGGGGKVKG